MKVAHVISGLNTGGAEILLASLADAFVRRGIPQLVVSLGDIGTIGPRIEAMGVPVMPLGLSRASDLPIVLYKLWRSIRSFRPDVVQTWLYHADLIGGTVARFAGGAKIAWGIHHSNLDASANKPGTLRVAEFCSRLSPYIPDRIICCAEVARAVHVKYGYREDKMVVIPNGIDPSVFYRNPESGQKFKEILGFDSDVQMIGWAGRYNAQKNPEGFIDAAIAVSKVHPTVRFVMVGQGIEPSNPTLAKRIRESGIADRLTLMGRMDSMTEFYSAVDLLVSSSIGEAMPMGVGEAMACEVPCVVTDVGDCAMLVDRTGLVAPAHEPSALAARISQWLYLTREERQRLGFEARKRILEKFTLSSMVESYLECYKNILRDRKR